MNKTHKLGAFFSPIICLIYVVVASLISGTLEEKLSGAGGFIVANLVAIALALAVVLVFIAINKKHSLDTDVGLRLNEKEKRILIFLVLLVPLVFIIGHYASYFIYIKIMGVEYVATAYPVEDFKEDMLAVLHAIIVAPILEEFCFRVIPISLCQKKIGKFVMLMVTSILFGFCHGKNFWLTMINGIIFGLIFIFTNRPVIAVICHMVHNFFSFIVGIVAYAGFATIFTYDGRPTLVLLDAIPGIVTTVAFVAGVILAGFKLDKVV